MTKSIFKKMGGTYREVNGYLIPNIEVPKNANLRDIGNYGRKHLNYIKHHNYSFYFKMLTFGKLRSYLADINGQAVEMEKNIIQRMAESEGVDENLKCKNQLRWIILMNNFRHCAEEIVNSSIIYVGGIYK